jgi:hypothetical protein
MAAVRPFMNQRLLVAVWHFKAAIPLSANFSRSEMRPFWS